jgi:hypothetical protein
LEFFEGCGPFRRASEVGDENLPELFPGFDRLWGKVVETCSSRISEVKLHGVIPRAAAYGYSGEEIVQPNSPVLLPIELGDAFTDFEPFWQGCSVDVKAEIFRTALLIIIDVEGGWLIATMRVEGSALCTGQVDPVLNEGVPKTLG